MAGNDVERDLGTAGRLGLTTFHVDMAANDGGERSGSLLQLRSWIEANESSLQAAGVPDARGSAGRAGVQPGGAAGHDRRDRAPMIGRHEASAEDWAMVELVCHLRDTEREVHSQQITTLLEAESPFVARPDAAVWAKQRRYLGENGP